MSQSSSTFKNALEFLSKSSTPFFLFSFVIFSFFYVMKTTKHVEYINTPIFLLKNAFFFLDCSLSCLSLLLVQVSEIELLIT